MIEEKTIKVEPCPEAVTLRWWENGWHYYGFKHPITVTANVTAKDTRYLSLERYGAHRAATSRDSSFSYTLSAIGLDDGGINAMTGLLLSPEVYEHDPCSGEWLEVKVEKTGQQVRGGEDPAGSIEIKITRKDLPEEAGTSEIGQQLYINGELCELEEGEVVAVTKQCNSIDDLQDRRADYSQVFRVKKTPAMAKIFEMAGDKGVKSRFPYIKHHCRYLAGGVELFGEAVLNLVSVTDDYYNVSVYSGNAGMFAPLEEAKLAELDLDTTVHEWHIVPMAESHQYDRDYCYPLVEPSDDGGLIAGHMTSNACAVYAGHVWPFIKVKAIWDKIFQGRGFRYGGELFGAGNLNLIKDGYRMFSSSTNVNAVQTSTMPLTAGKTYTFSAKGKRTQGEACVASIEIFTPDRWWRSVFLNETVTGVTHMTFIAEFSGVHDIRVYFVTSNPTELEWVMLQEGNVYIDDNTQFKQTAEEEVTNKENLLEDSGTMTGTAPAGLDLEALRLTSITLVPNYLRPPVLKNGKLYTLTFGNVTLSSGSLFSFRIYNITDDSWHYVNDAAPVGDNVSFTFRLPNDGKNYGLYAYIGVRGATGGKTITLNNIMLQEGPFATPWLPFGVPVTDKFGSLFMPIASRDNSGLDVSPYLYGLSMTVGSSAMEFLSDKSWVRPQGTVTMRRGNGDFRYNLVYNAQIQGTYRFRITAYFHYLRKRLEKVYPVINNIEGAEVGVSEISSHHDPQGNPFDAYVFNVDIGLANRDKLEFIFSKCEPFMVDINCESIDAPLLEFGSENMDLAKHLPDMTQAEFIKMVCNMFGLIPQTFRGGYVYFWTYSELLRNKVKARDWSGYLSVSGQTTSFKLTGYARDNYFKYRDSDDVTPNVSNGILTVSDENLDKSTDKIQLPVSSTDEVYLMDDVMASRIAFTKLTSGDAFPVTYKGEKKIDPRIVAIARQARAKTKTMSIYGNQDLSGTHIVVTNPKIARGIPLYFSNLLGENYAGLQSILEGATVRVLKFDLPALEVAAVKHFIPVYLEQYGEYYLINKISNYVEGRLCDVELIKI